MLIAHKLSNYLLLKSQRALGLRRIVGKPYHIVLDPTSYCQLDCPFCGREPRPLSTLKFADFKRIIDSVGKTCVNLELYNWGEPFLNKEILDMIRYATGRYRIYTRISSNLNLRNDDLYRELVSSGLNWLTISIDGASQETYEKYRVKGSFEQVLRNIELLVARKRELSMVEPKLVWQFLVFRHNEHEMETAERMARELGVDEIAFRKPNISDEYRAWDSTIPRFSSFGGSASPGDGARAGSNGQRTAAATPPADGHGGGETPDRGESDPSQPVVAASGKTRCDWPYSSVAINANGAVSPCCGISRPEDDFGNLDDAEFADIWNNDQYRTARRFISEHVVAPDSGNICAKCPIKGTMNYSASPMQLLYYTVPWLRRLWLKRRGFKVKTD